MALVSRSARAAAWWMVLSLVFASGALAGQQPSPKPKPPPTEVKVPKPGKKQTKSKGKDAHKRKESRSKGRKQGPRKEDQDGDQQTLVLTLRHSSAERMAGHVKRLFGGGSRVHLSADEPTNILLVRAYPQTLEQIRHLIDLLEDAAAEAARPAERELRVFRIEYADAERVGDMIGELAPFTFDGPPPAVEWDRRTNTLLVNGGRGDWPAVERIIEALDVRG